MTTNNDAPLISFVDELAQEIRRVDGNHDKGAGALAEALVPFLRRHCQPAMPADAEAAELAEKIRYASSLPEVECSRCGLRVISSCKSQNGCPVPDAYARRRIEGES